MDLHEPSETCQVYYCELKSLLHLNVLHPTNGSIFFQFVTCLMPTELHHSKSSKDFIVPQLSLECHLWESLSVTSGDFCTLDSRCVNPNRKKNYRLKYCHFVGRNSTFMDITPSNQKKKTRMLISIVSRFICRCLSSLFKELWPFENRKMYRNVLKIHF